MGMDRDRPDIPWHSRVLRGGLVRGITAYGERVLKAKGK
jgi:hypothetical protein